MAKPEEMERFNHGFHKVLG